MYAIAIIRYRRPLEEVVEVTEQHRAYLRELKEEGTLLASGPMDPRNGGMLLLRVSDNDVNGCLDRVRDGDPYVTSLDRGDRKRGSRYDRVLRS